MDITIEDAELQAKVLREAGLASPVPQIAAVLRRRAKEWSTAAQDMRDALGDKSQGRILLVGTVEAGMNVLDAGDAEVLRVIHQGTNVSLQVRDERGVVGYMNFISSQSPVVALL